MLRLQNVTKGFGGLLAVDDVSFLLPDTGISGLVGPNGSGKTTLFHLSTGFYRADRGEIRFRNRPITRTPAHRISRMGLVRTFQMTRILPELTVLDNLMAAPFNQGGERLIRLLLRPAAVRREEAGNRDHAEEVLRLLKLDALRARRAAQLSFGQQRLLELGRVLMTEPRAILLDEPTAGINPTLIRQLIVVIRELRSKGIPILLIEHNMPLVIEICDHLLVMDSGRLIFEGAPADAVRNDRVIEAYLGRAGRAV